MSMHYEYGQDAHSIFELLTDPDFLVDRCMELGELEASFELYTTDDGCCYAIDHTVKAKVPLIGGQVEKFIKGQVADGCLAEMEYVEQQLG